MWLKPVQHRMNRVPFITLHTTVTVDHVSVRNHRLDVDLVQHLVPRQPNNTKQGGRGLVDQPDIADNAVQRSSFLLVEVDDVVRQFDDVLGSDPESGKMDLHVRQRLLHLLRESAVDERAFCVGSPLTCEEYDPARRGYDDVTVDRRRIERSLGIEMPELGHHQLLDARPGAAGLVVSICILCSDRSTLRACIFEFRLRGRSFQHR